MKCTFYFHFSHMVLAVKSMGKASKWIKNLLMGKREDKGKKAGTLVPAETCTPLRAPVASTTPRERTRWSFRISSNNKANGHKSTRSFDSIHVLKDATFDYKSRKDGVMMPTKLNAHEAATKIQAAYRSYLARRALRALRALVKLQALARGYLVRKQMNTVLRSIHAVMAIQVRARIHRIQMVAEEPPIMMRRRKSYGEPPASDRHLRKEISENTVNGNSFTRYGGLRSRSGRVEHIPTETVDYVHKECASAHPLVSQREYQLKMSSSPSTLYFTDSSSTTWDGQLEELSGKMARRNSRRYTENRHHPQSQCPDYVLSNSNFVPNYMTNTKSTEAKARSHSEPRQRPKLGTKQKSKRSSSMDGKKKISTLG